MPTYNAPLEDIRFVLHEMLNVESLSKLPAYEETASA
ncbi:MAG: acyl-CoA dehydrogenase N-terminal domain-containing protein, partial [Bdellovibrionales bacterium]